MTSAAVPTLWVLKGFRVGDNAQAMALALRVGGNVVEKQLDFTGMSGLPNALGGASIRSLTIDAQSSLTPPWPDMVIATGRRTAAAAVWIKQQSGSRTRIVQLGRPRLPLRHFDLVITTPQYGLPQADNVIHLPLPFVPDRKTENVVLPWINLPKPWLVAVVGGQKFPLRLGDAELRGFGSAVNALAAKKNASVIVLASPRSPANAISLVAQSITQPMWQPERGAANAYGVALMTGDMFCVTSDSVSMVAEMLARRKPVFVQMLPESPWMPHWSAESGLAAAMARSGLVVPPRDVAGMMRGLIAEGYVGDLQAGREPARQLDVETVYGDAAARVRSLVGL